MSQQEQDRSKSNERVGADYKGSGLNNIFNMTRAEQEVNSSENDLSRFGGNSNYNNVTRFGGDKTRIVFGQADESINSVVSREQSSDKDPDVSHFGEKTLFNSQYLDQTRLIADSNSQAQTRAQSNANNSIFPQHKIAHERPAGTPGGQSAN